MQQPAQARNQGSLAGIRGRTLYHECALGHVPSMTQFGASQPFPLQLLIMPRTTQYSFMKILPLPATVHFWPRRRFVFRVPCVSRAVLALMVSILTGLYGALASSWVVADSTTALSVIDDSQQHVILDRPAKRIISLAPHATEMLYAAGAGNRVVGRRQF